MSFVNFLRSCKSRLAVAGSTKKVVVHMGNEANDLDSIACGLVGAFLTSHVDDTRCSVPLLPLARADLTRCTDSVCALKLAGIDDDVREHGLFLDELGAPQLAALQAAHRLELTLLDHNKLSTTMQPLAASVVRIIDHHKDEQCYNAKQRTVACLFCVLSG